MYKAHKLYKNICELFKAFHENTLYLLNFATTKTFVEIYQIASCIIYSYVHIEDSPTKNHKGDKP